MEPTVTQRDLTSLQLIQEVGDWAVANFGTKRTPHTAILGMMEELGEGSHCVLKRFQGIRGFADHDHFIRNLTDAMADFMIYLADFCAQHNVFFMFRHNDCIFAQQDMDEHFVMSHVMTQLSSLFCFVNNVQRESGDALHGATYTTMVQKVATAMEYWAYIHNLDLQKITNATWCATVSKRNWKKNATNAHEVAVD